MAHDFCIYCRVAGMFFRRWGKDLRFLVILLVLVVTEQLQTRGMVEQSGSIGVAVNGFAVFPTMINNGVILGTLIMYAGAILLFCDAPFLDDNQRDVLLRTKRKNYCAGTFLYIVLAAAVYVAVIVALSVVFLVGNLGFSAGWGTYFESAASGWNDETVGNLYVSGFLVANYTALEAFVYQMVLLTLGVIMFAFIIYIGNLSRKKSWGMLVCGVLVALAQLPDFLVGSKWVCWISPVNLMEISCLFRTPTNGYPSVAYALIVLAGIDLVLAVTARRLFMKKDLVFQGE